ncbi:MAG: alpha-2-macroglobulin [Pirellulales bacterium]
MNTKRLVLAALISLCGLLSLGWIVMAYEEAVAVPQRAAVQKLFNDGNWNEAYQGYRKLALDKDVDPRQVGQDLHMAIQALQNLGRTDEIDEFREAVIAAQAANWRLLHSAADSYLNVQHHGFIVAGEFDRGGRRGGDGKPVNSYERDRVRALQLMQQALPLVQKEEDHNAAASFYLALGDMLLGNRGDQEAWRLQYLTDIAVLPDYEEGWYFGQQTGGAPVDAAGQPVYHAAPKSWETATSDGERWRWCLVQAVEMNNGLKNQVRYRFAQFLQAQFGVQTMRSYGYWFGGRDQDDGNKDESGTYALHTLGENETIARLATGIKRFNLPDEFNFIKVYQQIADDPQTGLGDQSLEQLAQIFENRRQYPKAADYWRRAIKEYGPGPHNHRQHRLDQILNPWGRFEPSTVQPAGKGAKLGFRFRNGKQVQFTAKKIEVGKLLTDVKAYLKKKPGQLDWQQINISDFGWRFIQEGQEAYVGGQVAQWDLQLEPRPNHFDKRIDVTTPLQKAGAYLVTAKVEGGNEFQEVVWISDTVIVKKPMPDKTYYFVADAVTGKPIAGANVEFFGYRQWYDGKTNTPHLDVTNFAEKADANGQVQLTLKDTYDQHQWIVSATTPEGRFAHLGFTHMWRGHYYDAQYEATKVFAITDRPVYRPKQTVKFKFWIRHAKYDQEDVSDFANQDFQVVIHNPKGDNILEQTIKSDEYGGLEGELALPEDATLGVYQLVLVNHGSGNFRVEEYKKPEFEVNVQAPTEPVMLGEKISAKIEAKYLFGAPVTKAKVKYKVTRTSYSQQWYPIGRWDWFYGRGYWWYAYDYLWYPGWQEWGCARPAPWWYGGAQVPPEIVAEAEVEIGADGSVPVEIDTSLAKEMHGNQDHNYSITAEVVDASRRTIVGTGSVIVARRPFKVFSWVDRGYYTVGDTIEASFDAHTPDNKPVKGTGKLRLLRVTYDPKTNEPIETEVEAWELDTNDQGRATQQIAANQPGQYRLSYHVTDAALHTIEGGYVFTIRGQGVRSASFRFDDLELIPDKKEYAPGEKLRLQVNTNQIGGTVLLFVRPANGVYLPPQVLRLKGKSTLVELDVIKKDMPNFFIEALTLSDGQLHSDTKEIVVPPEKRVLNVQLEPSQETYKPGQEAEVKLTLTDLAGKPFVGSTVMAIYDKAVEYISGGSNVPEIKEFFWKWRRQHNVQTESNLSQYFYNLVKPPQLGMSDLGVFGGSVVDEAGEGGVELEMAANGMGGFGGGRGGNAKLRKSSMAGAPGADAALPMAAMEMLQADAAGDSNDRAIALGDAGGPGAPQVQPTVRTNFADTALWAGSLKTDGDGVATVKLTMPESLTTWKVRTWAMGHGTKVGQGDVEVITKKNLLVRLQAPRFFTQKDEVVLSANVHNYLDHAKQVQVVLELDGPALAGMGELSRTVEIAAHDELRVDWRVKVVEEGEAIVRMKGLTDEESDAVQMSFPAYVHGMLKMESFAGVIRPNENDDRFELKVPAERRINESRIEIRYSPTLAGAMVDALPYLVDYPYGCTEQTLSRFLPTVITQKILLDMQLDLKTIQDKRTNLNAQEIGDDVERSKGWKRYERNPVFDQQEVQNMVKEGVKRLTDMQCGDGGWGWFSGWGEHSYPHTTAYVVHGLQLAVHNDVALVPGMLDRGVAWLKRYQDGEVQKLKNAPSKTMPWKDKADNLDAFVFMVLTDADVKNADMQEFLYRDRTALAVYAKSMFGIALHKLGDQEKLAMILQNIGQFLQQDDENQTAWLKLPEDNYWWYWYGSEIEAQSYYLKLLAKTDPQGETASRLVKYLLNNRKHSTYWNSTRDTAVAIEALAEFLKASGESKPDLALEVWLDGKLHKEVQITGENLFTFDNKLVLVGDAVETGIHTVELKKKGNGPLYWNAYLTTFTLEDHIEKAGLEVKVDRHYYKLNKVEKKIKVAGARGQAVDQKVEKYERQELANLQTLKSGDLVEVELVIDSKNDYEYLIFEDMKAAGFEPVEIQSGYNGNDLHAYVEFRDNRVAFFARALARGRHSVSYRLRAEIPGKFSALPTRAHAMYAPELKGNSDEIKLLIED